MKDLDKRTYVGDKRRFNGGHSTKGRAGRKPMKIEDDVLGAIKRALADDPKQLTRIWQTVLKKAEEGSEKHASLFFAYYYGRPTQEIQVNRKSLEIQRVIIDKTDGGDITEIGHTILEDTK